jgi:hypothetical protein
MMHWVVWSYEEYNRYHFEYRQQDIQNAYSESMKVKVLERFLKSDRADFYVDMGIPLTVEERVTLGSDPKKLLFEVIAHTITEEQTNRTREKRITDKLINAYN